MLIYKAAIWSTLQLKQSELNSVILYPGSLSWNDPK